MFLFKNSFYGQPDKVHSPSIFCVVLSDLMGFWDASISPLYNNPSYSRILIGSCL